MSDKDLLEKEMNQDNKGADDDPYLRLLFSNNFVHLIFGILMLSTLTDWLFHGMELDIFWLNQHPSAKYLKLSTVHDAKNFIVLYGSAGIIFTWHTCMYLLFKWDKKQKKVFIDTNNFKRLVGSILCVLLFGLCAFTAFGLFEGTYDWFGLHIGYFILKLCYIVNWLALNTAISFSYMSFILLLRKR